MIFWIIICIGLIISVYKGYNYNPSYRNKADLPDKILTFVGCFVASIAVGFIVSCIVGTAVQDSKLSSYVSDSKKLVAVQDDVTRNSESNGAFLLIAGGYNSSSEEDLNYAWYSQDPETHAITAEHGIAEDFNTKVEIYYLKNGEQPHVEHIDFNCSTENAEWISPINLSIEEGNCIDGAGDEIWRLYVPRGSVEREISFDLK